MKSKTILLLGLALMGGVILSSEIALRSYGFCDAPLSKESDKYEYCFQPNQDRYRFRKHIEINSFCQRSEEPRKNCRKILGLGDSVIYGTNNVDQDSIATTIFTNETGIQMLNVSAGSWGPDNIAAYLNENGLFDAEAMVVVLSSHDAHDIMDFEPCVDVHPAYPSKQYTFALGELFDRYLIPMAKRKLGIGKKELDPDEAANEAAKTDIRKNCNKGFNPGWDQLKEIAQNAGIPMYIYLHAEKGEVVEGKYNDQGEEIIAWASANNIPLYKGIDMGENLESYQDDIHLNNKGQRLLADNLIRIMYRNKPENKQSKGTMSRIAK